MPGSGLASLVGLFPRATRGPRIFVSYRRHGDSAGYAARLADRLEAHFGDEECFRDIEDIESGADFVRAIEAALESCRVMVVVIGTDWISMEDDEGNRRLDDPHDFVRLEVAAALRRDIGVIPALVCDATMPSPDDLPADLKDLWRRQAVELSDRRWDYDVGHLIAAIEELGIRGRRRAGSALARGLKTGLVAVAAVGLFLLGQLLWDELGRRSGPEATGDPSASDAAVDLEATDPGDLLAARYRDALVGAIDAANEERNRAQETLDTGGLAHVFEGPAYQIEVAEVRRLFDRDEVAYNTLEARRFLDFRVDSTEASAEVDVLETWSSEHRNALTDACLFRIPAHPIRRTVDLRRTPDGWIVRSSTGPADPGPARVGC